MQCIFEFTLHAQRILNVKPQDVAILVEQVCSRNARFCEVVEQALISVNKAHDFVSRISSKLLGLLQVTANVGCDYLDAMLRERREDFDGNTAKLFNTCPRVVVPKNEHRVLVAQELVELVLCVVDISYGDVADFVANQLRACRGVSSAENHLRFANCRTA